MFSSCAMPSIRLNDSFTNDIIIENVDVCVCVWFVCVPLGCILLLFSFELNDNVELLYIYEHFYVVRTRVRIYKTQRNTILYCLHLYLNIECKEN